MLKQTDGTTQSPPVKRPWRRFGRRRATSATGTKKTTNTKVPYSWSPDEDLPDGTFLTEMYIPGQPATKKNHNEKTNTGGFLPSKQYRAYEPVCKPYCEAAWKNKGKPPIHFGVKVIMHVKLNRWNVGDHNGYMQSLGDIMEKWGVLANDKYIHWGEDGTHWFQGVDKENPGVTIKIYRYRHLIEDFRKNKEKEEAAKILRREQTEQKRALAAQKRADKLAQSILKDN